MTDDRDEDAPRAWYTSSSSNDMGPIDPPEPPKPPPPPPRPITSADFGREGFDRAGTALVIGRFSPPHLGHQYMLRCALTRAERLIAIVRGRADDTLPAELRAGWLREIAPGADVRVLHAEDPPGTPADEAWWKAWASAVRTVAPEAIDAMYTSDPRSWRLASALGARFRAVDTPREVFPITASAVRQAPLASWRWLPECVRPHFAARVALVGPEGAGKSTLARVLASRHDTVFAPEQLRLIADWKKDIKPEDLGEAARAQIAAEDTIARAANRLLICDTELWSLVLWAQRLYGLAPDWLIAAARARRYDAWLLCAPDLGVATKPGEEADRNAFLARWEALAIAEQLPIVRITGTGAARTEAADDVIVGLLP